MDKPFQRKGAISNAHVGRDFEASIQDFLLDRGAFNAVNYCPDWD